MGDPVEIDSGHAWEDQRSTYDVLRSRCAVAREDESWVVLRHAEVVEAATDPRTFSSRVTKRRAIPNSLDGAEHAAYRAVVDRYLTDERVAREEHQCRGHAAAIVDALPRGVTVKTIASIGVPFAAFAVHLARLAARPRGRPGPVDPGAPRGDEVGEPRQDEGGGRAVRPHDQRAARDSPG